MLKIRFLPKPMVKTGFINTFFLFLLLFEGIVSHATGIKIRANGSMNLDKPAPPPPRPPIAPPTPRCRAHRRSSWCGGGDPPTAASPLDCTPRSESAAAATATALSPLAAVGGNLIPGEKVIGTGYPLLSITHATKVGRIPLWWWSILILLLLT